MPKRILIIETCDIADEPHECNSVCEQALLYGIDVVDTYVKHNQLH